jgi:hypothetical protein
MIVLMGIAFAALIGWLVIELSGVISPEAEDTFSEIIFDLHISVVVAVALLFVITGILFVWSAGHFLEGYARRRRIEARTKQLSAGDDERNA